MATTIHSQQFDPIFQSLSILNVNELDLLMQEILVLRRQKMPSVLTKSETELLRNINAGAPTVIQRKYNSLVKKRSDETLSDEEYSELLKLTSYMESLNVKRLANLIELANLRNVSLDELIEQLQIKPRYNAA